ncbi:Fe-S cluster domain-containing protein [Clostridium tyrobutyricum]|jgi:Na+-translocating ferredoxin:NAD+ oxidoreductase RNF subunit RnfB|uniref:Ion-translocating oxidoreductase complex subunit B n=1 Tax=Clostridium tyrobutyricum DIVETGP TaxID=1408889 RepID=W6NAR2_CLOTY|nr:Fe-S cluster domain-containing protein [Clostridium tyrobutyricum]AND84569.1 electron transport complex protein RnfB [Clostridium tyrobutyricum]ANP69179.1 RnfABCDGE type electron transport complex subunit B [Clostridium tyrobutyricum]MBR9648983.1 Fe-S cluster domain-containing protein [Clostridium tyrobutyricum]MBV4433431.1 Fe-S cluster domain-containing protein [Clostridium tyrobutyricum]MBV4448289.1 Fe-S cluster domain-containing protein [Clostridium tyrobutyricum]
MNTAIMVLIVMTAIGLVFGLVLGYANKRFAIESNPLIDLVEDELPKGQCGGCGYAGCRAYAEAVVLDKEVSPSLCVPGKAAVAEKVAKLTGKSAEEMEPKVAYVMCNGNLKNATRRYEYQGVKDCSAANLLQGGPKGCSFGCIGFGTCVRNCPFDAMMMGKNGIPLIDTDICIGCGKCASVCPKNVISLIPVGTKVEVQCNSHDKGVKVRKNCTVGCLGCGMCSRNCEHNAIKIEDNLAVVNPEICINECSEEKCLTKCPTGAIKEILLNLNNAQKNKEEVAVK